MANSEHLHILKTDTQSWNEWRRKNPSITPDLSGSDLRNMELDLESGDFSPITKTTNLPGFGLDFRGVDFSKADFRGTFMDSANLVGSLLRDANLTNAFISNSFLSGADLTGADFTTARFSRNQLGSNDLSQTIGLETIRHFGPSLIGIDTLFLSAGKIPDAFLRGCGVPESFIAYIPSLVSAKQAIQFYSCFISYSHKDEAFARRLHERMRADELRVWFAPEDMKGGKKLREQIDNAIQIHDRLLLVLSKHSMESDWVQSEIRRARRVEMAENRQKLFPIRLVDFESIRSWECFDADSGRDLARDIREYFVPDFTNWTDHATFESAYDRLLEDLRAAEAIIP